MTSDEQIGKNVAMLRGALSQKEVATRMRELGWKWSQATVWSIEKGERPLRLAEAEALAQVLGVSSQLFVRSERTARLQQAMGQVSALNAEFEGLLESYGEALWNLAVVADEMEPLSEHYAEAVADWLEQTPEKIVADQGRKNAVMAKAHREIEKQQAGYDDELEQKVHDEMMAMRGHFERLLSENWKVEHPHG